MAINFPDSPNVNQEFSVGDNTWKWNGSTWDILISTLVGPAGATGATGPEGSGYSSTTSGTSVVVETGSKAFTVSALGAYLSGQRVRVISVTEPNNFLEGSISSIVNNVITVNVSNVTGSGTFSNWVFSIAGSIGPQGLKGDKGDQGDQGDPGVDAPDIVSVKTVPLIGGDSYTIIASDKSKMIEISNSAAASGLDSTFYVTSDGVVDFDIGTSITILRSGTGNVVVSGDGVSGVVVNYTPTNRLRARWSSATLVKRAANSWILVGDLQ
jgi:hypothetical protein